MEILLRSHKRDLTYCLQNCSEGRCYEAAVPCRYDSPSSEIGIVVSRGVQEKNKDQQVATIVQDRTMKLEEVSSSP